MQILLAMQAEPGLGLNSATIAQAFARGWCQVRKEDSFAYLPISLRPGDYAPVAEFSTLPPGSSPVCLTPTGSFLSVSTENEDTGSISAKKPDYFFPSSPAEWGKTLGECILSGYTEIDCYLPASYWKGQTEFIYRNGEAELSLREIILFPKVFFAGLSQVLLSEEYLSSQEIINKKTVATQANSSSFNGQTLSHPGTTAVILCSYEPDRLPLLEGENSTALTEYSLTETAIAQVREKLGTTKLSFYCPQDLSLAGAEGLLPQIVTSSAAKTTSERETIPQKSLVEAEKSLNKSQKSVFPLLENSLDNPQAIANRIYQNFSKWEKSFPNPQILRENQLGKYPSILSLPGSGSGAGVGALGAILGGSINRWQPVFPENIDKYDLIISYQNLISSWTLPDSPLAKLAKTCTNAPLVVWADENQCGNRELAEWGIDGAYQLKNTGDSLEKWHDAGKRCAYNWGL